MKKQITPKQRIITFFNDVDWAFGINGYEKELCFPEEDKDQIAAEINYREKYQDVTIYIYPRFFKQSLDKQRKTLLHELCHSITLPSKSAIYDTLDGKLITPDRASQIDETAASKIENLLHALLIGKLKYFKDAYKNYLKYPFNPSV